MMENGNNMEPNHILSNRSMHSSPLSDHMSYYSEINRHFVMARAQNLSTKAVVKVVEDLSYQICKYQALALSLGTILDGDSLRKELAEMQQKSCNSVSSARMQLSDAFKRADSFPKKEIADLERSCRVLVACIHMLDRELRRTMHLYHLFPLIPDADEARECCFINTGLSDKQDIRNNNALITLDYGQAEKYFRERDSWQELEKEILELHSLDVALHRDETLGPIMDYLTLCPMGLDNISCSTASVDDVCSPSDTCVDDNMSRKKSNILCYVVAIMTFACVGGGVLMGVIFMIVY